MRSIQIIFLFFFILSGNILQSQTQFTGTIIDQKTAEPLIGVSITASKVKSYMTNNIGGFDFTIDQMPETFLLSYIGYENQTILSKDLNGIIKLSPSTTTLNQIIVSANRTAQARKDVPIAISSLSSQTLEEAKATRLDEVLNKVTGVYMVDLGNEQHTMAIRQPINYKGLFLYLEDGLPIRPTGVFNHNALLEMNMAALSRIEVIRGPAASIYGSEAIGGAINFITLKPSPVLTGKISLQGNTNAYQRLDFNASSTFGKLGIGVSGYYAQRRNGLMEHNDFDKTALTFRADYFINDQSTLSFDASYIDYYADMTGSLDSTFFYSKNYTSQQTFTNRAVDALRAKLTYHYYWESGSKTTIATFARDNSIRQNPSYRVTDDYSPWSNPAGDQSLAHGEINDNQVKSIGLIAQHRQAFKWLSGANLTIGASMDNSPNKFMANYISIDKSDQNVYTGFTKSDSVLTDYKVDLLNFGAYVNLSIKLTKSLQFSGALRYDVLNFNFQNNLDKNAFSGAPDDIDNFKALTPKIGLTYDLGKENGLFVNYSQGFLPPQISELYRGVKIPTLQPATFHNYEIGAWFHLNDKLSFDLSFYQMDGQNEIISVLLDNGARENQNAGKTQHRGIEYGVNWKAINDLHLRVSGTHAKHTFINYIENGADYSNNEMGQAPSWIMNSELIYKPKFIPNLRVSAEWQHIDDYFMDNANSASYEGHDIFNFRVGYAFKGFEIWSNIMNVSNVNYATVARRSRWGDSYSLGEPRVISLGLGYTFR